MGHFKTFCLGLLTAYGIYYISKKGPDGKSILDELLANPKEFLQDAKDMALQDTARTIRNIVT